MKTDGPSGRAAAAFGSIGISMPVSEWLQKPNFQ
jgi:hypothetical protein